MSDLSPILFADLLGLTEGIDAPPAEILSSQQIRQAESMVRPSSFPPLLPPAPTAGMPFADHAPLALPSYQTDAAHVAPRLQRIAFFVSWKRSSPSSVAPGADLRFDPPSLSASLPLLFSSTGATFVPLPSLPPSDLPPKLLGSLRSIGSSLVRLYSVDNWSVQDSALLSSRSRLSEGGLRALAQDHQDGR